MTAALYDADITTIYNQLKLEKIYFLYNATVKDNRSEFKGSPEDKIWSITDKTKVEELNEDNLNFIFSIYQLTPLNKLKRHWY